MRLKASKYGCRLISLAWFAFAVKKGRIKHQTEKYGWEFIFLAANINAAETAKSIGIRCERAANYRQTKAGVHRSYYAMCEAITNVRTNCADEIDLDEHLKEDE